VQIDIGVALYVADNLATMEYRLQEEIMLVVQLLCAAISGCAILVGLSETARVEGKEEDVIVGKMAIIGEVCLASSTERCTS
jgi:cohesin loading factor subunit SCC2